MFTELNIDISDKNGMARNDKDWKDEEGEQKEPRMLCMQDGATSCFLLKENPVVAIISFES